MRSLFTIRLYYDTMAAAAKAALNNFIVRPTAEKNAKDGIRDKEVVSRYRLDRELIILLKMS